MKVIASPQLTVRLPSHLIERLDAYVNEHRAESRSTAVANALEVFLPALAPRLSRAPAGAGQDAETGRAGRDFGVTAGRALAEQLGNLISPTANELELPDGRGTATVRTAKNRNTQWGCLNTIRDRVTVIFCAYTRDETNFDVWEITPGQWVQNARPASLGHKLHGALTLVSKSDVERVGKYVGRFRI